MRPPVGQASARVAAPPDRVFEVITDIEHVPSWNGRIEEVVEVPDELRDGAEWVVAMNVLGRRFNSRSHVIELDRAGRRFVYRSKREDDNPSFTIWTWEVEPDGEWSRVTLGWEFRPATIFRKRVISPLRHRMIERDEAPASLIALAKAC